DGDKSFEGAHWPASTPCPTVVMRRLMSQSRGNGFGSPCEYIFRSFGSGCVGASSSSSGSSSSKSSSISGGSSPSGSGAGAGLLSASGGASSSSDSSAGAGSSTSSSIGSAAGSS